jgi:hypothetical protein
MKNKVRLIGAGLLALLLTLTGCFTPLNDPADAAGESSGTKIVVEVGGLDRTLAPDVSGVKYAVTIRDYYNKSTVLDDDEVEFAAAKEYSLEPGKYTVYVWAYTGEYKGVAWGEDKEVTLENGKTERLKINLAPLTGEDVPGTFSYSVVYPVTGYVSDATLTLEPADSNSGTVEVKFLEGGAKESSLQLPPGKYKLTVSVKSGQIGNNEKGVLQATAKETVYIYPNLTTLGEFTFTDADFSALLYFSGSARINADGGLGYVPKKVQIKLYDGEDEEDWNDAHVQEDDITWDELNKAWYWELLVPSNDINPYDVQTPKFRFTAETAGGTKKLASAWDPQDMGYNIQGLSNIDLYANIYQVSKAEAIGTSANITGVSGIAGNTDAIAATEVRLKLVPAAANYGVIGSALDIPELNEWEKRVDPDGTLVFTMPQQDVTVNGEFFHLTGQGFPEVSGAGEDNYTQAVIKAFEETSEVDPVSEEPVLRLIGESASIASTIEKDKTWSISIPKGYATDPDGTGKIYFQIILTGQDVDKHEALNTDYYLFASNLTGLDARINLPPVPLDEIPNLRAEPLSLTSVRLTWDAVPWAANGYKVYKEGSEVAVTIPTGTTTYAATNLTEGTLTWFSVAGVRGNNAEGEATQVYALPQLVAPQNVSVTKAAGGNQPFQVRVSWDRNENANGYDIYRNGEPIGSGWNNTYTDSSVWTDSWFSYEVVARNTEYDNTDSARSDASEQIIFTTQYLPLSLSIDSDDWTNGSIADAGEVDYYRFTEGWYNTYYVAVSGYSSGTDFYLYKNGSRVDNRTNLAYTDTMSVGYLYPGDEVILAVKDSFGSNTGDYWVKIYSNDD